MTAAVGAWRREEGSVTVLVVGLVPALLLLAGLLFDGARILTARREAFTVADNVARVAAQAVDVDSVRADTAPRLDPAAAQDAARAYLDRHGHDGTVTVTGERVEVTVTLTVPLVFLDVAGLDSRTVRGVGRSRIVRGVTGPETP